MWKSPISPIKSENTQIPTHNRGHLYPRKKARELQCAGTSSCTLRWNCGWSTRQLRGLEGSSVHTRTVKVQNDVQRWRNCKAPEKNDEKAGSGSPPRETLRRKLVEANWQTHLMKYIGESLVNATVDARRTAVRLTTDLDRRRTIGSWQSMR